MFRSSLIQVAVLFVLCCHGGFVAQGEDAPANDTSAGELKEKIADLIKQLDADSFAKRQRASQELAQLGKAAIAALGAAAGGDSREATTRALELLKKHLEAGDEATKSAAKAELEKLVAGKNPLAARGAEQALQTKKKNGGAPADDDLFGAPIQLQAGGIQIGGNVQIQIQAQAQAGNGQKVSVSIINGVKKVDATEKDRRVKITEAPGQPIKMEVTETKDGKETTQSYEAKDADDLKKKHPEAHKLYQRFAQNGVKVQFNAAPVVPMEK